MATIDPSLPEIIASFVVMLGGFFAITKLMLNQASKDREADRTERELFAAAVTNMAAASEKVAKATEKSAKEAKQRNGHLGEQSQMIAKLVTQGNEIDNEILGHLQTSSAKTASLLKENTESTAHEVQVVADTLKQSQESA